MATTTYREMRDATLASPSVYFWAKELIRLLENKDVLDAVHGLRHVLGLFEVRFAESLEEEIEDAINV